MDFSSYVDQIESLYLRTLGRELGTFPSPSSLSQKLGFSPKRLMIIAPHPDDECLMSGLALRAKQECGTRVSVLSFSFGSDPGRRIARKEELKKALEVLGFHSLFDLFGPEASLEELGQHEIEAALRDFDPDAVLIPGRSDGHPTHIRCSELSWRAVRSFVRASSKCVRVFETEYWGRLESPDLQIPLSSEIVKIMGSALLCHQGEILRNPYHLTLPSYLMDQQRRGSEGGAGFGGRPEPAIFAQLYQSTQVQP